MRFENTLRLLVVLLIIGALSCSMAPYNNTHKLTEDSNVSLLLFDFETPLKEGRIEAVEVNARQTVSEQNGVLKILSSPGKKIQGVILKPEGNHWNLSPYEYLEVSILNRGKNHLDLVCQVENPERGAFNNFNAREVTIQPGATRRLRVTFIRISPTGTTMFGMKGFPGRLVQRNGLRPEIVSQLRLTIGNSDVTHDFEVDEVIAGGSYSYPDWMFRKEDEYFPCVDKYGQFVHADWPQKTQCDEDLQAEVERERKDLKKNVGPVGWNEYGGWKNGPHFEEKAAFYTKKYEDKWWLVDPAGHLFWLHGINCVRFNNGATPISDREHWYEGLPGENGALSQFLEKGQSARRGYYAGRSFRTFDFSRANLFRKYGTDWESICSDLAHTRLRSWGFNTIGNWSEERIYSKAKTPYVTNIAFRRKTLEGGPNFPDPFDPGFKSNLMERLTKEQGKTAEDPWCIGYFVDNELRWMTDISLACYTLQSPASQPAKKFFIEDLKDRYPSIGHLNRAWGTRHSSWTELGGSMTLPDSDGGCREDLLDFSEKVADTYFRKVSEAIRAITPNRLYLGCRFGQFAATGIAVAAAARYCDVVSFNLYKPFNRSASSISLPESVDKPIVVGEFHFGALDRGPLSTGLAPVENQVERAASHRRYVKQALRNPCVIGTNWFQYSDQATTGRADGENYQIGFLDICDTPYEETVSAAREVGSEMYSYRSSKHH
ncbi:MAG: hypothetical protein ACWGQW_08560 [bacterium]